MCVWGGGGGETREEGRGGEQREKRTGFPRMTRPCKSINTKNFTCFFVLLSAKAPRKKIIMENYFQ